MCSFLFKHYQKLFILPKVKLNMPRNAGCRGLPTDKRTDLWFRDFIIWKINFGLWAVGLGWTV